MERNDIIKALECCYMQELEHNENCPECPYTDLYPNCAEYLGKHAFALIKELTEENDAAALSYLALTKENERLKARDADIDKRIIAYTVRKMRKRIEEEARACEILFGNSKAADIIYQIPKRKLDEMENELLERKEANATD